MTAAPQGHLRVLIAGERFAYPHGFGATARVAAYARGLQEAGAEARVVSLLPPSPAGTGSKEGAAGVDHGVPFEYACGTRERAASFAGRRWLEIRRLIRLWTVAGDLFAGEAGRGAIIAYTNAPGWIAFMALVAKARGAVCLVELCELPFVYESSPAKRAVNRWLLDRIAYRLVDGFITISSELERYVEEHAPGVPCLRVPILVIASEFEDDAAPDRGERADEDAAVPAARPRQVVYTGDLGHQGEIMDLLMAFARVAPSRPDVVLTLVGAARRELRAQIEARAAELGLAERIVLTGHVERTRLPGILGAASALVLLRRDAEFSRAGLPTKLAEYLASGRPVVVTAIGDIPLYLTDGVDAYLTPPEDAGLFAEKLGFVLDHEAEAAAVGDRGRQTALREFDHRRHGERLSAFIAGLHQGRRVPAGRTTADPRKG